MNNDIRIFIDCCNLGCLGSTIVTWPTFLFYCTWQILLNNWTESHQKLLSNGMQISCPLQLTDYKTQTILKQHESHSNNHIHCNTVSKHNLCLIHVWCWHLLQPGVDGLALSIFTSEEMQTMWKKDLKKKNCLKLGCRFSAFLFLKCDHKGMVCLWLLVLTRCNDYDVMTSLCYGIWHDISKQGFSSKPLLP